MKRDTRSRVSTGRILYMLGSRWMAEICCIEVNGRKKSGLSKKRSFLALMAHFLFLPFSFFFFFYFIVPMLSNTQI
jgi:hypothetical protein